MKEKIHPKYNPKAQVECDCGAKFEVGSTVDKIHTEICYQCNPLYTGESRIVDTAGRVEKFKARSAKTTTLKTKKAEAAKAKKQKHES